jgi:hemerythrin-like domain-containing protein
MNPVEILIHEHKDVVKALDLAEKAARKLENKENVPQEFWVDLVSFLRGFADKCHHAKEEGYLLPAVQKYGGEQFKECANNIFREHEQGRAYIKNIEQGANNFYAGDESAKTGIIKNARSYVGLLRSHIAREDNCFPKAAGSLPGNILKEIEAGFEKVETEEIGAGVHEKYKAMLQKIEKYLD